MKHRQDRTCPWNEPEVSAAQGLGDHLRFSVTDCGHMHCETRKESPVVDCRFLSMNGAGWFSPPLLSYRRNNEKPIQMPVPL